MNKQIIVAIGIIFSFLGCKEAKSTKTAALNDEVSIIEKVANAHGFKDWKKVKELAFTFNVDRDTTHYERSWIWNTSTNDVTAIGNQDTITYNRHKLDSISYKINGNFINDKYWFLAPFNLMWDRHNFTFEHQKESIAPISKTPVQKLTIVYGNNGGYTPGDAYDFYFGDDFLIKEWVFRRGNQSTPSVTTTWEDYKDHNGLQLATMHKNEDGSFKLYFNQLKITFKTP
ncbi:hypothetical protein SAMN04487911_1134 [Arenibacter nanhaiticus]|uniref:Uncharacterized protein n=1 Tax=Arenibacter nanhaiticus TaxID=558155 RepID=A0A1M6H5N2_9FLAO|nr:hypothetical protein [Arenibacter nanhaiticus]SHJ17452.1 hypothetical protein SAMN04487911_1134 [Arenibacter nanhaiticus]